MFEIDHRAIDGVHVPTSTLKLYRGGAWTLFSTTAGGKRGSSASGCLDRDVVAQIARDIKSSTWSIHYRPIRCMARSTSYTVYSAFGRAVYTERMCNGAVLDAKSRGNLNDIESLLVPSADSFVQAPIDDDDHFAKPPSRR